MTAFTREKTAITLDDVLAMGDRRIEIIDGQIIDMPFGGGIHQLCGRNTYRVLDTHVSNTGIGEVFFDGLTYLMNSPLANLKDSFMPDVSFIRLSNIPADWDITKPHPGVPTLAVEVVSPGDQAEDIQKKVRTYLNKGTEQVWVLYPLTKELHQFIGGDPETVRSYKLGETIDAEALFPGIQGLTTDALFALPAWAQPK